MSRHMRVQHCSRLSQWARIPQSSRRPKSSPSAVPEQATVRGMGSEDFTNECSRNRGQDRLEIRSPKGRLTDTDVVTRVT